MESGWDPQFEQHPSALVSSRSSNSVSTAINHMARFIHIFEGFDVPFAIACLILYRIYLCFSCWIIHFSKVYKPSTLPFIQVDLYLDGERPLDYLVPPFCWLTQSLLAKTDSPLTLETTIVDG